MPSRSSFPCAIGNAAPEWCAPGRLVLPLPAPVPVLSDSLDEFRGHAVRFGVLADHDPCRPVRGPSLAGLLLRPDPRRLEHYHAFAGRSDTLAVLGGFPYELHRARLGPGSLHALATAR